ncbi:hypothetical protein ABIA39_003469 [Nocardia sp. GAS34]|uniref:hypothetical protein n=1 Tax=unclassified Nocardia TaxID=2637762 RepID=UPI003D1FAEFB
MVTLEELYETARRCLDPAPSPQPILAASAVADLMDALLWHVAWSDHRDIDRAGPARSRRGDMVDPAAVVAVIARVLIRSGVTLGRADGTVIDEVDLHLVRDLPIPARPAVAGQYVVARGRPIAGHAEPGDTVHFLAPDCLDEAPYLVLESFEASLAVTADGGEPPLLHCLDLYRLRELDSDREILSDLAGRGWAHAELSALAADTDFFTLGRSAHTHGMPPVPVLDANVVRAYSSLVPALGDSFAAQLKHDWLDGWRWGEMLNPGSSHR